MDIVTLDFNDNLTVVLPQGQVVLSLRKTSIHSAVSFGVEAPKAIRWTEKKFISLRSKTTPNQMRQAKNFLEIKNHN